MRYQKDPNVKMLVLLGEVTFFVYAWMSVWVFVVVVWVYMFVCVCVSMCVYLHVCVLCLHIYVCVCMCLYMCMLCVCVCVCLCTCICVSVCVCVWMCTYVCVCVCVCVSLSLSYCLTVLGWSFSHGKHRSLLPRTARTLYLPHYEPFPTMSGISTRFWSQVKFCTVGIEPEVVCPVRNNFALYPFIKDAFLCTVMHTYAYFTGGRCGRVSHCGSFEGWSHQQTSHCLVHWNLCQDVLIRGKVLTD